MSKSNSRLSILGALLAQTGQLVGGQAVIDGVMIRNDDMYGVAARGPDGEIVAQRLRWRSFIKKPCLRRPFLRGFPTLLESMVNGIHALNLSARLADAREEAADESGGWQTVLTICAALAFAAFLFVIAPHILSILMLSLDLGGDVEGLSFHLWDGLFKCVIFMAYIGIISLLPDIRRVFQYHGAEHKTIHAWENCDLVNARVASGMSRLHPRCGTTFLLFVICVSIIIQALLVPLLLAIWEPDKALAKHALSIFYKTLLVIPISAVSYEILKLAAKLPDDFRGRILRAPGMALQKLTTREPDIKQLEVAVVALATALGDEGIDTVQPDAYCQLSPSCGRSNDVC